MLGLEASQTITDTDYLDIEMSAAPQGGCDITDRMLRSISI